jgi:D-alanyl-D-alanine carboxypeptidase
VFTSVDISSLIHSRQTLQNQKMSSGEERREKMKRMAAKFCAGQTLGMALWLHPAQASALLWSALQRTAAAVAGDLKAAAAL